MDVETHVPLQLKYKTLMQKSLRLVSATPLKVATLAIAVPQNTSPRKVNNLSSVPARINSYFSYLSYTFVL